jgi:hypothetical protein
MGSGQWFLLKNRRHVGPYTPADIKVMWVEGQIKPDDYVILSDDAVEGELKYRKIFEVFPELKAIGRALNLADVKLDEVAPQHSDRELRSFTDEDILKNEASRIFSESFDSVDLTNASRIVYQEQGLRVAEKKRPPGQPPPRTLADPETETAAPVQPTRPLLKSRWIPVVAVSALAVLGVYALISSDSKKLGDESRAIASKSGGAEHNASKAMPKLPASKVQSAPVVADKPKPTIQVPTIEAPDLAPASQDTAIQESPLPGYTIPEIEEGGVDAAHNSHEPASEPSPKAKKKKSRKADSFEDDTVDAAGEVDAQESEESDGE